MVMGGVSTLIKRILGKDWVLSDVIPRATVILKHDVRFRICHTEILLMFTTSYYCCFGKVASVILETPGSCNDWQRYLLLRMSGFSLSSTPKLSTSKML